MSSDLRGGWLRLLEPTGDEAAERAAADEEPRPGVWAGETGADFRKLTQDQTDLLIRVELIARAPRDERAQVIAACGGRGISAVAMEPHPGRFATCQRGGIDSDPLVRLLAWRLWGDRDRSPYWHIERVAVTEWTILRNTGGIYTVIEGGVPPQGIATTRQLSTFGSRHIGPKISLSPPVPKWARKRGRAQR